MLWMAVAFVAIVWIATRIVSSIEVGPANPSQRSFKKLVKQVQTDENKGQIDQLIKYHNQRVNAGAETQESFNRLVRDVAQLGDEGQFDGLVQECIMSRTVKKVKIKVRNWLAVDARERHTAGSMGDKRKEKSRKECRTWKRKEKDNAEDQQSGALR